MGRGLLLALPVESVALRALAGVLVAAVVFRPLSRRVLRAPRARVVAALAPFGALVAVVALALPDPALPALLRPTTSVGDLLLPISGGYVPFAASTATALVVAWFGVASALLARRVRQAVVLRREALADAVVAPVRVQATVGRLSRALELAPPVAMVAPRLRGGALLLGVRRPVVVLDARLVDDLDDDELEGVLAHELAHVVRRDNLLAWTVSGLRDLVFVLPGAAWAMRSLHRERELAADQVAVETTGRPGALASGLLKVLEVAPRRLRPCATLAPEGGLVERIALLVDDAAPTPRRQRREVLAVGAALVVVVAATTTVPRLLVGTDGQREAIGVMVAATGVPEGTAVDRGAAPARAFDVLGRSALTATTTSAPAVTALGAADVEDRAANLRACADPDLVCFGPARGTGLGLTPRPVLLVDEVATARWQATPVVGPEAGERFGLYWLARLRDPASAGSLLVASQGR